MADLNNPAPHVRLTLCPQQLTGIRDLLTIWEPLSAPGNKKTGVPGAPLGFINATSESEIIVALVFA